MLIGFFVKHKICTYIEISLEGAQFDPTFNFPPIGAGRHGRQIGRVIGGASPISLKEKVEFQSKCLKCSNEMIIGKGDFYRTQVYLGSDLWVWMSVAN